MKRILQERVRGVTWIPPCQMPDTQTQVRVASELERANGRTTSKANEPIPSTSKQNQDNSPKIVLEAMSDNDSEDDSDELIIDEDQDQQANPAQAIEPPKKKTKQDNESGLPQKAKRKRAKRKRKNIQRQETLLRPLKPKDDLLATSARTDQEMIGIFEERIFNAIRSLNQQGKRACGFDIKKIHIETTDGIVFLPLWLAIIDGVNEPRFNQIIWYPQSAIENIQEAGLTVQHMEKARKFDDVRRDAIDTLLQYDMICVANGLDDFKAMSFTNQDWKLIRPRIRDVNYYYNPRPNPFLQFDMRLSRFLFFQKIIQNNVHSALIDAMYKLFLYLIDYENFEATFDEISSNLSDPPYAIHLYPQNHQMAGLLRKIMDHIGGWPASLIIEQNPLCVTQPQYSRDEFIHAPDVLRPPYENVTPILFKDFIHPQITHQ